MSCSDLMYQFYPTTLQHRPDAPRYGSQPLDFGHPSGSYSYLGDSRSIAKREIPETAPYDPDSEPKGSQYLNHNCLLLTYFNGDISTVVDEHFSRALSQPSSFSTDRNGNQSLNTKRPDSNLMCNRKFPASFWISDYQPPRPSFGTHTNQDFSRDLYSASSWYNWPYHFPSSYTNTSELSRSFPYSSFDPMGKLSPSYQSLMFRSGLDTRNTKFDRSKIPDPLSGSSYYGLSRLGADLPNSMNFEPSTPGLDYSLQTMRKELCW